jgi:GR25 family glycosyltransferase involved in LPS biosynthesis
MNYDKYHIYYINLKNRISRNEKMVKLLEENFNIEYERIEAINGNDLNISNLIEENVVGNNHYNLRRGVIGCSLSHISSWKKFLNSSYEYGIFFEDDIDINKKYFNDVFDKVINFIPNIIFDWCYLSFNSLGNLKAYEGCEINDYLYIPNELSYGCQAYILSKTGVSKLIKYYDKVKIYHPVDFTYRIKYDYNRFFNEEFNFIAVKPDFKYYNFEYTTYQYSKEFCIYAVDFNDSDTSKIK